MNRGTPPPGSAQRLTKGNASRHLTVTRITVIAEGVRYMGSAFGDGNTGDSYASDQATGGDCDGSRAFGFVGERRAAKEQGLYRPKDVCDSAGSLPYRILIGLCL